MAYEEDQDYPQETNALSASSNYMLPFGDPLAFARVSALPGPSADVARAAGTPNIRMASIQPTPIPKPAEVPVPEPRPTFGGGGGNELSPVQEQANLQSQPYTSNMFPNLDQLLQARAAQAIGLGQPQQTTQMGTPTGPHSRGVSATNAGGYQDLVNAASTKYGADPGLMTHMFFRESGYQPDITSKAGARGIPQFMPDTAREMGLRVDDKVDERTDPAKSIDAGVAYFAKMKKKFNGNDQLALAAYNWGPDAVHNWLKSGADVSKVPKETQDYVRDISGKPLGPNSANVPSKDATATSGTQDTTGSAGVDDMNARMKQAQHLMALRMLMQGMQLGKSGYDPWGIHNYAAGAMGRGF